MNNAGIERVIIGEFEISRDDERHPILPEGSIWITHESGEGGEFSEEKLAAVIREFYKENF